MSNPDSVQTIVPHVSKSFSAQPLMATFGATLVAAAEGRARIDSPILDRARQQHGFGHAGLTFSLGDSAAGYAALSLLTEQEEILPTEMKINLLSPARGDRLEAVGWVEKAGRSLMVVSARVHAVTGEDRALIALLQGTMMPIRP